MVVIHVIRHFNSHKEKGGEGGLKAKNKSIILTISFIVALEHMKSHTGAVFPSGHQKHIRGCRLRKKEQMICNSNDPH